jgi:hypothetical protein
VGLPPGAVAGSAAVVGLRPGAVAGPAAVVLRPEVAGPAAVVPQPAEAVLASAAGPRRVAVPSARPRAVDLSAAAWVFRRDQALPLPVPPPAARLVHAMAGKRIASL